MGRKKKLAGKASFVVKAGDLEISSDIEVLDGLKQNDQIVTGSYQVIRTIRNESRVKVDNTTAQVTKSST